MHRLVIALTTLLTLVGGVVIGGYLLFFSASTDRAASVVPAGTPIYVNFYLQPSSAQQMNLAGLLGRLPGFGDQATLDTKIDEVVQRLLAGSGLDYRRDLKPWLGDQLAVAVKPADATANNVQVLVIAAVKDRAAAGGALDRLVRRDGAAPTEESYRGISLRSSPTSAYAFVADDRLVVIGRDAAQVRAAIDTSSGATASLGDDSAFRAAMADLPPDHLASVYLDLDGLATLSGMAKQLAGFSTANLALVAGDEGLHVIGQVPFDQAQAGPSGRAGFALSAEPASLSDWMPVRTQAEAVVFGLRQGLEQAEASIGRQQGAEQIAQVIAQARAVIAFGLGLNVDEDLLPLFDRESAIAVSGLGEPMPHGQLLLRPSNPDAGQQSLDRIRDALKQRGAQVTTSDADGVTITTLEVPQTGSVSYTMTDGVIIVALIPDDVAAAVSAHANGETLSASDSYKHTFAVAGARGGTELYVDLPSILDGLGASIDLPAETRDILSHVTGVGVTAPARENRIEFHAIATIE